MERSSMRTQRTRKKAIIAICTFLVASLMFGASIASANAESAKGEIIKKAFPEMQKELDEQHMTYEEAEHLGRKDSAITSKLIPYEEATSALKNRAKNMPKPVDVEALLKNEKNQKIETGSQK